MVTLTKPTRSLSVSLIRFGGLVVNSIGTTPIEFDNLRDVNWIVGSSFDSMPDDPTPAFTHPDAGAVAASDYDDVIVDTDPLVKADGTIITNDDPEIYRLISATATPFWVLIRCTGYGRTLFESRDPALALLKRVMQSIVLDLDSYRMMDLLRGFAFLSPDLNVLFPDQTVIDRTFQSALVQEAHAYRRAACFITSRPNDAVTLVAPKIDQNANSGLSLPNPIIGAFPPYRDRISILYPNAAATFPNISVVVTQIAASFGFRLRDGGFTPNLDWAYIIPDNVVGASPDGVGGVTSSKVIRKRLRDVIGFLAALGVNTVGLQSGPVSALVSVLDDLLPSTTSVNTTGRCQVWSVNGVTHVRYTASDGIAVTRRFGSDFVEILGDASVI